MCIIDSGFVVEIFLTFRGDISNTKYILGLIVLFQKKKNANDAITACVYRRANMCFGVIFLHKTFKCQVNISTFKKCLL